ncbi:MAG: hypothetical protein ABIL62_02395 [Planctomycetota bacterium]
MLSIGNGADTHDKPRAASVEFVGDDLCSRLMGRAARHGTCGERGDVPSGRFPLVIFLECDN